MKKIKTGFLKKYNALITLLITLLGFSTACEKEDDEPGYPATEYGVPHAVFRVKGKVQSENNSSSISNIRVVMNYDTAYTDETGVYEVRAVDFPDDQSYVVEFDDIDGAANGEYQSKDSVVVFKDSEYVGGSGSWYRGEAEKELNVKLKS